MKNIRSTPIGMNLPKATTRSNGRGLALFFQAELLGLLLKVGNLNLTLLAVNRVETKR